MIPLKQLGRLLRPGLMLPFLLLAGCNSAILNPKGQIGHDEKQLLITSVVLMLIVVIPVIVMTIAFAWKYRASNTKARYEPDWSHSTAIEVVVWSIPCVIILVLAVLTWRSSHALDPYRPLDSDVKPITIEAVSLDWKWMFIYPDQNIATVNEIAFPVHTPLNFKITSDTVMNSFFIPHLGTMIYAMAGMETKLHLVANEPGEYFGLSTNYSGHGFFEDELQGACHRSGWLRCVGGQGQGVADRVECCRVPGAGCQSQRQGTVSGHLLLVGAGRHVPLAGRQIHEWSRPQ